MNKQTLQFLLMVLVGISAGFLGYAIEEGFINSVLGLLSVITIYIIGFVRGQMNEDDA